VKRALEVRAKHSRTRNSAAISANLFAVPHERTHAGFAGGGEHPRAPRWAARFGGRWALALVLGAQLMIILDLTW
jgi:hypothetical protein